MLALATLQHTVNAFLKLIFDKHPLVVLQSILVFASALIAILRIGNNDLMHCEKYFRMIRVKEQVEKPDYSVTLIGFFHMCDLGVSFTFYSRKKYKIIVNIFKEWSFDP